MNALPKALAVHHGVKNRRINCWRQHFVQQQKLEEIVDHTTKSCRCYGESNKKIKSYIHTIQRCFEM